MLVLPKQTVPRPHGALLLEGRAIADLLQCCHCQYTWRLQPGSGRLRGFCFRCAAVTCGKAACEPCLPIDARLELEAQASA